MKPSPDFCSRSRNDLRGAGVGLGLGAQPWPPSPQGGPALPRSGVGTAGSGTGGREAAAEMPSTGLHIGMAKVDLSKM